MSLFFQGSKIFYRKISYHREPPLKKLVLRLFSHALQKYNGKSHTAHTFPKHSGFVPISNSSGSK